MSTSKKDRKFFICNLLLAIIVFAVPLIVRVKVINLTGNAFKFWKGDTVHGDFFSYYKSIWLISLTFLLIIAFSIYILMKQIKFKKFPLLFTPIAAYLFFVFLSFSYSDYKDIALLGFTDRYEGFLVILSYIVICFIASYTISAESDVELIFGFLLASMVVVSAIGISQFFSHDFFQTNFGKQLIAPSIENLDFKFPDKYIYSTMYNPNFVGTYFSMLVPLCLSMFLLSSKLKWKLTFAFLGAISLFALIGSRSSTGYIATAIACLFILVFLRRQIFKYWIFVVILLVVFVGSTYYINNKYDNIVLNEINKVFSEMKPSTEDTASDFVPGILTDIDIDHNVTKLFFGNEFLQLIFKPETGQFDFKDSQDTTIILNKSESDPNTITFADERFTGISVNIKNQILGVKTLNSYLYLYITSDSGIKYLTPSGSISDFVNPNHIGFDGYEEWGSSRGYIWSRSLPLIKDTILLGHGSDTYAIYFPQTDLSGKLKYAKDINILVDKPHSMYLQMAINTGLISMLAFIAFIIIYIIQCCRLYFIRPNLNNYYKFGVTCMFSVIGFCFSGLANDSVVSVSPVFWILLGVGIGCNRLYTQSINPAKK